MAAKRDGQSFQTAGELRECCEFWQALLRLADWDIVTRITRAKEFHDEGEEYTLAEIMPNEEMKQAILRVLDPADYQNKDFLQDHEHDVVHELLHLHLWEWKPRTRAEKRALETAINQIAKTLVGLKRIGFKANKVK